MCLACCIEPKRNATSTVMPFKLPCKSVDRSDKWIFRATCLFNSGPFQEAGRLPEACGQQVGIKFSTAAHRSSSDRSLQLLQELERCHLKSQLVWLPVKGDACKLGHTSGVTQLFLAFSLCQALLGIKLYMAAVTATQPQRRPAWRYGVCEARSRLQPHPVA